MSYETVKRAIVGLEKRQLDSLTPDKADEVIGNRFDDEMCVCTDTFSEVMYAIAGTDFGFDQGLDVFVGGIIQHVDGTNAVHNNRTPPHLLKPLLIRCLKDIALRLLEAADSFEEGPPCAVRPIPGRSVTDYTVQVTKTVTHVACISHRTVFPSALAEEVTRKAMSHHHGIDWTRGSVQVEYDVLDSRQIHYED